MTYGILCFRDLHLSTNRGALPITPRPESRTTMAKNIRGIGQSTQKRPIETRTGQTAGASKARKKEKVTQSADTDRIEAQGPDRGENTAPLTDQVRKGWEIIARKYYGDDGDVQEGKEFRLRQSTPESKSALDKVISPEVREMKALQYARELRVPIATARELVDSIALLLAPSNV